MTESWVPLERLNDLDPELREVAEEALRQAGWELDWIARAYRPPDPARNPPKRPARRKRQFISLRYPRITTTYLHGAPWSRRVDHGGHHITEAILQPISREAIDRLLDRL